MEGGDCAFPCPAVWWCLLQKLYTLPLHQFCSFRPSQILGLSPQMDWTVWPVWPPYQFEITAVECRKQKPSTFSAYIAFTHNSIAQEHACSLEGETCWSFFNGIKLPSSPQMLEIVKTSGPYGICTEKATRRGWHIEETSVITWST